MVPGWAFLYLSFGECIFGGTPLGTELLGRRAGWSDFSSYCWRFSKVTVPGHPTPTSGRRSRRPRAGQLSGRSPLPVPAVPAVPLWQWSGISELPLAAVSRTQHASSRPFFRWVVCLCLLCCTNSLYILGRRPWFGKRVANLCPTRGLTAHSLSGVF